MNTHRIITKSCHRMSQKHIEESGCAICGRLTPLLQLSPLKHVQKYLHILEVPNTIQKERLSAKDPKEFLNAPILADHCTQVCNECRASIRKGNVPKYALAHGLWLGDVPDVLKKLRYIERLLIARVRYSCCFVRISNGRTKMKANVIAFESPTPKLKDMDDVAAILFTGPTKPTADDFKRTPLLVRPKEVKEALQWLILNNPEYEDTQISQENLNSYEETMPPCSVEYKYADSNKTPEGTSLFDMEEEDGTDSGDCPFIVHGITGEDVNNLTIDQLKAKAWQHFEKGGKVLAVGQSNLCESLWKNPRLYGKMFPHLFPYGAGIYGSCDISERDHRKSLLLYHDKRFQTDPHFPFVAFSHMQIKNCSDAAWLLTDKKSFQDISNRLLNVDLKLINMIAHKLELKEPFKPSTPEEINCFQLISDIDQVAGHVDGSTTTKKYMRNEIWSLISHQGAPSWYITISPADEKHPISLYYSVMVLKGILRNK
ncbi:hypothetical protein F5051DRAFT_463411 [Lentinula edodes]|nr:hypothetical protein F5051DRAFT_463411 [Lentinula edodes]